ncbi:hypothetical protein GCM10028868_19280 [Virgibacillus kimchii]
MLMKSVTVKDENSEVLLIVYNAFILIASSVQVLTRLLTTEYKKKGKKDNISFFPFVQLANFRCLYDIHYLCEGRIEHLPP